ncbi:hypothetical protein CKO51_11745 [Rhodopirellula sp. SM50]|nr:hypothetical protein CKO51_11745 [Rhodopirellula sp. SM50]
MVVLYPKGRSIRLERKTAQCRSDREARATRKPKTIGDQSEGCSEGSSDQLDRNTILPILQRDR